MVGWQRHLKSLLHQVGKRVEHNYTPISNFSSSSVVDHPILHGKLPYLQKFWKSTTSVNNPRPYYRCLQQLGISSSRLLQADSSETPIRSPLIPALTPLNSEKTEEQKAASKPATVQAVLKGIKQSPKKINLVAALVRGMRVEDALIQLQVTVKRAAKTVYQVIHSARANATHNHGLDPNRLLVAEAFVGKGNFQKRISYHSKGRAGIKERPECRLTIVVRETTPEEEAKIARLKVHNFRHLSKREQRLVPHKLIETTPVWDRKGKRTTPQPSGVEE